MSDLTTTERLAGLTVGQRLIRLGRTLRVGRLTTAQRKVIGVLVAAGALLILLLNAPPVQASDFADAFYPGGKQVLHGYLHYATSHIYSLGIYRYPPIAAVFVAPFALMPVKSAVYAWWIVGAALVTACCYALARVVQ